LPLGHSTLTASFTFPLYDLPPWVLRVNCRQNRAQSTKTQPLSHAPIALFLDRKQGSTFHQIFTNHPNWQFKAPLSAKQLLRSRSDLRLDFIARQMHAAGEIRGHMVHWMSGKLEVTLRNGQSRTFSDPASLLQMASQVTCNLETKEKGLAEEAQKQVVTLYPHFFFAGHK
jgi:hypothetical protein